MRAALDDFVIRGVSSNIPFQAALLGHPRFVAGDFNTGFIAENYAQGFRTEDVPHDDPDLLLALAAFVHRQYRQRASQISGQMAGHELSIDQDLVLVALGQQGALGSTAARISGFDFASGTGTITVGVKTYTICSQHRLGEVRISGSCNGAPFTAQVERGVVAGNKPLALRVSHRGRRLDLLVLSPRAAELYALMPHKAPPDMSRFVLSPMPGLLVELAVQPGQRVQAGERVAVIEAMKMENVLFAAADGVVGKVLAARGDSLTVDQPIVEFA